MNDQTAATPHRSSLTTAIVGGLIGSVLTAVLLLLVAPQFLSVRIVREGMLRNPAVLTETVDALRDQQYAPVLTANRAAIETPFGSSWKGSATPAVTLVEFYDYACPYCKGSNPIIDRLVQENKDLRVVYRELPILGADSLTAARQALNASKAGRFMQFHDAMWAAGRPSADTVAKASAVANIPPAPGADQQIDAELKRNLGLAEQLGATGTPLFIVGNRVLNGAVAYDVLNQAIKGARQAG